MRRADYLAAAELRSIFIKTVNEDLTESARSTSCPVLLVYGLDDTETPPELAFEVRVNVVLLVSVTLISVPADDVR